MRRGMVAGGMQLDEVGRLLHTMDLPEGWQTAGWLIRDNGFVAPFKDGEGNIRRIGIFPQFPQNGENWNNGGANSNRLEYSTGVEDFEGVLENMQKKWDKDAVNPRKNPAAWFFSEDEKGAAKPPTFFTDSAKKQYKAAWWAHHNNNKTERIRG
jgi:hypothetical protein